VNHDEFITKVGGRADVSLENAGAVAAATLRTLAERISGGEARDLAAQLPKELQPHLTEVEEAAQRFDVDEFVHRVAERSGLTPDRARKGIQAVFATIGEAVTAGELDDIMAQLPKSYAQLLDA
jgi:uncharacterized protein (DUF2267 family)